MKAYNSETTGRIRRHTVGAICCFFFAVIAFGMGIADGRAVTFAVSAFFLFAAIVCLVDILKARATMREVDPESVDLKKENREQ